MDEAAVKNIIAEQLGISPDGLKEDTVLSDLGADSLDLFQIVSALEEEFEIEFETEDAERIKTVGDAVGYIKAVLEN